MNSKLATLVYLCVFFLCKLAKAQNSIDVTSRWNYALYLAHNHDYEGACLELYSLQNQNKLPIKIQSTYYFSWALKSGKNSIPISIIPDSDTAHYLKFLYLCKYQSYDRKSIPSYADSTVKQNALSLISKIDAESKSFEKQKYRAVILSILMPGMGKIYAKQYWEGFSTLGIVLVLSAYSAGGFYLGGWDSLLGWGFGSMVVVSYIAQIKGSVYTIKRLFKARKEELIDNAHYNFLY